MAQLEFVTVDVFTSRAYEGNPLAVVRIPHGVTVSQQQKQAIAREFNLSETTFLHEQQPGAEADKWTVDIFMTNKELPFAGHPTIGTACYALGRTARERGIEDGILKAEFKLKAGRVGLEYNVVKKTARASIPHDVHIHKRTYSRDELFALQPQLAKAHQEAQVSIKSEFPIVSIVKGMTFILIELESEEALGLVGLAGQTLVVDGLDEDWNETFVGSYFFVWTGDEGGRRTIRTRMIEGPLEDPATGSAASDLAAYLSLKEGSPDVQRYKITQGVEMGRRSDIYIDVVLDDKTISKLYLEGEAMEVMEGRLAV